MKKLILIVTGILMMGLSLNTSALTKSITNATVLRVLVDSEYYGGCMVQTNKIFSDYGLNCKGDWVSFSCDGTFNSQDIAFSKLVQAQMAMALNKLITLHVDDSKTHNGYCFARRIDIHQTK